LISGSLRKCAAFLGPGEYSKEMHMEFIIKWAVVLGRDSKIRSKIFGHHRADGIGNFFLTI
jgi:hypothetical protein